MLSSRSLITLIVLLGFVVAVRSQEPSRPSQAPLTNGDIVQMVTSGLSPELIIAKIKTSRSDFDTSPARLTELKEKGVSDGILVAMVEAGSTVRVTTPETQSDSHLDSARAALRSLRRLASATEVGISYVNYSPLVGEVKTEVDDTLSHVRDGSLKTSIQAALNEYAYAAYVWQATWRDEWITGGPLRDVAVNKYGVKKKGLLKVVWRTDLLNAIWREARNQFEIANSLLSQVQPATPSDGSSQKVIDDLIGAWRITLNGSNGQNVEFNLTVIQSVNGYRGTLRSPMGNSDNVQISKNGNTFTLYASEQEKKRTMSIELKGTIESGFMKGNATVGDGKQSASLIFVGTKLSN